MRNNMGEDADQNGGKRSNPACGMCNNLQHIFKICMFSLMQFVANGFLSEKKTLFLNITYLIILVPA